MRTRAPVLTQASHCSLPSQQKLSDHRHADYISIHRPPAARPPNAARFHPPAAVASVLHAQRDPGRAGDGQQHRQRRVACLSGLPGNQQAKQQADQPSVGSEKNDEGNKDE